MKIKVSSSSSVPGNAPGAKSIFKIKTISFEGPLEILLELIEKRKLFIGDIALAKVTDDFIVYIRQFDDLPVSDSANFILIASTLLLIKSKSLLPNLSISEDEQSDISDLNKRLSLLAKIKEGSAIVQKLFWKNILFETRRNKKASIVFSPDKMTTIHNLHSAITKVIASAPKTEKIPTATIKKVISLEEMIDNLSKRVTLALRMTFKDFSGAHKENKVNVIVGFLAMLELFKQGTIHVNQDVNFSDIHIESKSISVPRYN